MFVKPHLEGTEQARFDTADYNELSPATGRRLIAQVEASLPDLDLVIINEQIPDSLHAEWFRRELCAMADRWQGKFIVDSRYHANEYRDAFLRINDREAIQFQEGGERPDRPSRERVIAAMEALFAKARQPVFVSRGPDGVVIRDAQGLHEVPARRIDGPIDIVGAGDSLLAGISLALARGRDPVAAAELGILAASVTVAKLRRCGTASPAEILALLG